MRGWSGLPGGRRKRGLVHGRDVFRQDDFVSTRLGWLGDRHVLKGRSGDRRAGFVRRHRAVAGGTDDAPLAQEGPARVQVALRDGLVAQIAEVDLHPVVFRFSRRRCSRHPHLTTGPPRVFVRMAAFPQANAGASSRPIGPPGASLVAGSLCRLEPEVDKKIPRGSVFGGRSGVAASRRTHEFRSPDRLQVRRHVSRDDLLVPPGLAQRLDRIGLEFLAEVYEIEVARRPENEAALGDLGHVLTRLGRHERALEVDGELARRNPDDETVHYNLACSLALVGHIDAAIEAFGRACALGYDDADHAEADDDLAALRNDERFHALLARLRSARG